MHTLLILLSFAETAHVVSQCWTNNFRGWWHSSTNSHDHQFDSNQFSLPTSIIAQLSFRLHHQLELLFERLTAGVVVTRPSFECRLFGVSALTPKLQIGPDL